MKKAQSKRRKRSKPEKADPVVALNDAAQCGDLKTVTSLIRDGVDVNAQCTGLFRRGETALQRAVAGRYPDVVKALLHSGADPNLADQYGVRPIHWVRDVEILQLLLDAGADFSDVLPFRNFHGGPVLELLIQAGADIHAERMPGRTTLTEICFEDGYTIEERRRLVPLLVKAGASIDARDSEGKTLLHYAARSRDPDFLQYLIELGAPWDVRDSQGANAWDDLRGDHRWETKTYQPIKQRGIALGLYDPSIDQLVSHASKGKLADVKRLIADGADQNARGDLVSPDDPKYMLTGITPLDAAARFERLKTVEWLLENGADPNGQTTRPRNQCPILEAMTSEGRASVVRLLLDFGAEASRVDLFRLFLFRFGCGRWTNRQNECVELLIGAGIDVNAQREEDEGLQSVLDFARYTKNKSLIELLERAGAERAS